MNTTMTMPTVNAPLSAARSLLAPPHRCRIPGQVDVALGWTLIVQGLSNRSDGDSAELRLLARVVGRDTAWTHVELVREL